MQYPVILRYECDAKSGHSMLLGHGHDLDDALITVIPWDLGEQHVRGRCGHVMPHSTHKGNMARWSEDSILVHGVA